jgi:hypothetical protein
LSSAMVQDRKNMVQNKREKRDVEGLTDHSEHGGLAEKQGG